MLDAEQRVRYARHRSLVEIGDDGVLALLRATYAQRLSDPRADEVARDYLARAGVAPAEPTDTISVDVDAFAGAEDLAEAAAACLGAMHAVERIKAIVGVGRPAPAPDFSLADPPRDARDSDRSTP